MDAGVDDRFKSASIILSDLDSPPASGVSVTYSDIDFVGYADRHGVLEAILRVIDERPEERLGRDPAA